MRTAPCLRSYRFISIVKLLEMAGTGSEHSSEDHVRSLAFPPPFLVLLTPARRHQSIATGQLANTAVEGGERSIDRLSTLPPEVLSAIFKLVGKPVGQPLSKHLLPFHLEQLYDRIELWHRKAALKLSRLLRTIRDQPELARCIRKIELGTRRYGPQETPEYRAESLRKAHALLKRHTQLREVTLRNSYDHC